MKRQIVCGKPGIYERSGSALRSLTERGSGEVRQLRRFQLRVGMPWMSRLSLLLVCLLAGCASQPEISVEEQVGKRASQWAGALISLDYAEALTYMTPNYQNGPRAQRFRGDFSGAAFWSDYDIKWVRCDEESSLLSTPAATSVQSTDEASEDIAAPDNTDDCIRGTWNVCGDRSSVTDSASTAIAGNGTRCEVRLILDVYKPPEMSMPTPIPYDSVWLNLDGLWYMYRK
jgi:hypothetical protein